MPSDFLPAKIVVKPAQLLGRRRFFRLRYPALMGWITAFLVAISLLVPVKFVTEEPGPALNTLGEYDGKQLISIEGRKTYPTSGELAMTTVSVAGGPNTNIRALQTLATWLLPDTVVVPSDLMYSPTTTNEQVNTQNEADMTDSQEVAQAAALEYLKIDYDLKLTISGFIEQDGQEAAQQLQEGDQLLALGGNRLKTYDQVADILDNNGEKAIDVTFVREGKEQTVSLTPHYNQQAQHYVLGLYLEREYRFPFKVNYEVKEVGGPSAGMMFALGIIDELNQVDMTGGKKFAGTGTISAGGKVGPIGGIAQKMVGARQGGAEVFLAPAENCQEVVGKVPDGLSVVKVDSLSEAAEAVQKIGSGADPAQFPSCH